MVHFSNPIFRSALSKLHEDLHLLKPKNKYLNNNTISLKKSIVLENVSYTYPNSKLSSLKNINLFIPSNSKIGIVGHTGSGKTTIVDLIMGLLEQNKGNLKIDDKIIDNSNKRSWQSNIGYVPQQIYLSDTSVKSNIAFGVDDEKIDLASVENVENCKFT